MCANFGIGGPMDREELRVASIHLDSTRSITVSIRKRDREATWATTKNIILITFIVAITIITFIITNIIIVAILIFIVVILFRVIAVIVILIFIIVGMLVVVRTNVFVIIIISCIRGVNVVLTAAVAIFSNTCKLLTRTQRAPD